MDEENVPVIPVTRTAHRGMIVFHCRRCDTHVTVSVDSLEGRDITTLCLCGRGAIVQDNGERVAISQPWPVKPKAPAVAEDPIIAERERAARSEREARGRGEWTEPV